jgi:hypothetical protein
MDPTLASCIHALKVGSTVDRSRVIYRFPLISIGGTKDLPHGKLGDCEIDRFEAKVEWEGKPCPYGSGS